MAFRHLQTSLHPLHLSRFLRRTEEDYEFSGTFAYLKHQLSNFVQVAFFDTQDAENEFEWTLEILKKSIHRFNQRRFLRLPEGRL
jgi:hypothetical protein